jgi:hypothetical protein
MASESESAWTRGLLSKRERNVISGEADVSTNYRHQVEHKIRKRIEQLETDIEVLDENDQVLASSLRDAVCTEESGGAEE